MRGVGNVSLKKLLSVPSFMRCCGTVEDNAEGFTDDGWLVRFQMKVESPSKTTKVIYIIL